MYDESKRVKEIKKFLVQKIFSFLESHPTATVSPGVCRYAGMHGGKKGEMSTFFTPFPDTYSLHISLEKLASEVIAHATVTLGVYHLLPDSTHTRLGMPHAYPMHTLCIGQKEGRSKTSILASIFRHFSQ